ncbi:hypothetical protein BDV06DRAFT_227593 [Aspergillus oleicola]
MTAILLPISTLLATLTLTIPQTLLQVQAQTFGHFPIAGQGVIFAYEFNESWTLYPPCSSLTQRAGCITGVAQLSWTGCESWASHGNSTITLQSDNNTWLDIYWSFEAENYLLGAFDAESDVEGGDPVTVAIWSLLGENGDGIPPDFLVAQAPHVDYTAGPLFYLENSQGFNSDLAAVQTEAHSVGPFGLCFIRFHDWDDDDEEEGE